jgi:phage shock protein A
MESQQQIELAIQAARELATHATEIKSIAEKIDGHSEKIDALVDAIARIESKMSEIRGGWKLIVTISTLATGVIESVMSVIHHASK